MVINHSLKSATEESNSLLYRLKKKMQGQEGEDSYVSIEEYVGIFDVMCCMLPD